MDTPMDSGISSTSGSTRKTTKKREVFKRSWLEFEQLKGWLQPPVEGDGKAVCSVCEKSMTPKLSVLLNHSVSQSHIESCKLKTPSLSCATTKDRYNTSVKEVKTKTDVAELRVAAFIAEHNLSISVVEHLAPLIRDVFSDPEVSRNFYLTRKKCTSHLINVLGKCQTDELSLILRNSKFSVLVDQSTTIANKKLLCILVKCFGPEKKIQTRLFKLIGLDAADCSAEELFKALKSAFEEQNIPLSNIISISSDNASVMVGCNDSFVTRLSSVNPNLIILRSICHSCALVASKACAEIPVKCTQFLHLVGSYFSRSPKCSSQLAEFLKYHDLAELKILKVSGTRWLSMQKCIERILQNWIPLQQYFVLAGFKEQASTELTLRNCFHDDELLAYLYFLQFSLKIFNCFNALFQSSETLIHVLAEHSAVLLNQIAAYFLRPTVLDNLNVASISEENFLPLSSICVGDHCNAHLGQLDTQTTVTIRQNCLNFWKTSTLEILNKLPCRDEKLRALRFLNPAIALYSEGRQTVPNLDDLCRIFYLEECSQAIAQEWLNVPNEFLLPEKLKLQVLPIDIMWLQILDRKDFLGSEIFSNLGKLVISVLVLPHSNADPERLFSNVTDIVTKKRNKIDAALISALCQTISSPTMDLRDG